jgi:RNA polymerase sigma-70 factor (ECF subfamily)
MASGSPSEDLAERIRRGDPAAEETLVESYYGRVYAMVLVRTRNREVARDLAQETMLAVLCALREGRLNNPSGLTGYICATARNRVSYHYRHRKPEVSDLTLESSDSNLPDPEECFQTEERRQLVLRAITHLSRAEQKILRLTLVEGLKSGEIADRLKLKPEVVRKRKSRAIRRLRKALRNSRSQT